MQIINSRVISEVPLNTEPYTYVVGSGLINEEFIPELTSTFPEVKFGVRQLKNVKPEGLLKVLCDELLSPEFEKLLSEKLGIDLASYTPLIEFRQRTDERDGYNHTDIPDKVATFLLYMNESWSLCPNGCLRILNGNDLEDYAAEVPPVIGNFIAFVRSDKSWHGHHIHIGERRSIQMTWRKVMPDDPRSAIYVPK